MNCSFIYLVAYIYQFWNILNVKRKKMLKRYLCYLFNTPFEDYGQFQLFCIFFCSVDERKYHIIILNCQMYLHLYRKENISTIHVQNDNTIFLCGFVEIACKFTNNNANELISCNQMGLKFQKCSDMFLHQYFFFLSTKCQFRVFT